MALRPSLGLKQRQRLGLTQEIKSSLQYLALAGLRLEQTLQDVVESNPFLTVSMTHVAQEMPDWIETLATPGPDTLAAALRDLSHDLFWRPEDRALANLLIDEVAETGLLETPLARIDLPEGASRDDLARVRDAFLAEGGLLADDLGQCFAAQARQRAEEGRLEPDLLQAVLYVCENLELLRDEGPGELDLDPENLAEALAVLQDFSTQPADQLDLAEAIVLPPDLIVEAAASGWSVRLNPLTHRGYALDQDMLSGLTSTQQKRPEIVEPLKAARATVRALEARGQTLINLTTFLCEEQDTALRQGRARLKPLTQGEAAEALELHPSTISRAVAGKSAETPQGVWPLKDFFTALIDPETQFSGAQLRAWLTQAIAQEDPDRPLSDEALARDLQAEGHKVARRTITKYRLRLGLPGAAARRRAYARQNPSFNNRPNN